MSMRRKRGVVLIVVLWVIVGMTAMALTFGHSALFQNRVSSNAYSGRQAEHAIDGAREYALTVLAATEEFGKIPSSDEYKSEFAIGDAQVWFLAFPENGETNPVFGMRDESSKLNLNVATKEMLEALPGMTVELAAAIIDWRDEDDTPTEGGAEVETYSRKDPAYQTKNAAFESVDELMLVHGMTIDLLFGKDKNLNGIIEAHEEAAATAAKEKRFATVSDFGLAHFLTIHSEEANKSPDGEKRIDVNDRNPSKLKQVLTEKLGADKSGSVLQSTNAGRTTYHSLVQFFQNSKLEAEDFDAIDDYLIIGTDDVRQGPINVNTASTEVLTCIPNVEDADAAKLVEYRKGNPDQLDSVAWVTKAIDAKKALNIGPFITTNVSRYCVDAVAVGIHGRGLRRIVFIIDVSDDEPIVVFRRDLSAYGWCLGDEIRRESSAITEGGSL